MKRFIHPQFGLKSVLFFCLLIPWVNDQNVFAQQTPNQVLSSDQQDSLHQINWMNQTDSLISLNQTEFINYTRLGGMINGTEGCLTFNTSWMLSKYRTYNFGVGSGLEYYNRGTIIHVLQIPFFLSNHIFISRKVYFLFEPGIMVPVGGFYYSDIESSSALETKIKYADTDLKPGFYYNLGLGLYSESKICLELFIRNQSNGVLYPIHERITMVGLNMGVRL